MGATPMRSQPCRPHAVSPRLGPGVCVISLRVHSTERSSTDNSRGVAAWSPGHAAFYLDPARGLQTPALFSEPR